MPEIYQPTRSEVERSRLKPGLLKVSGDGVFFSIQGEGVSLGLPAVFLRLHLCNLKCGFCDTRYTWDQTLPEYWQESQDWSLNQTRREITKHSCKRLVITGGEPLLQQEELEALVKTLPDWEVEIETNGTIAPHRSLMQSCQFNVSPKLSNSGNPEKAAIHQALLNRFNHLDKTSFKFVARNGIDLEEVDQIVEECRLDSEKILIMPQGSTVDEMQQHSLRLVEGIKERCWRFSPRLHVYLWGNKRGI